ncbi:hypothetical protein P280DRAFT_481211 [Massarina eburnea CBS 473.64]|uniref:N-acetyltransferase domain-containing protein n=1 Tax=Massarina eburnea CBS 473.64 TaxID=1395130 RepID=A0A6A6RYH5_9PLEO|nr:hypothetical protein P280DRAFT_481211 [Massarina eburnea CBS 473.64]
MTNPPQLPPRRYSIHLAPSSNFGLETVSKFKALRLKALKDEPQYFFSTYNREIEFTNEQWEARLRNEKAYTFAAIPFSAHQPISPFSSNGYVHLAEANEWVGTATLVEIAPIASYPRPPPVEASMIFGIGGMYVHSGHRRHGIGALLLNACLDQAFRKAADSFSKFLLELQVERNNRNAVLLYAKLGFRPRANDPEALEIIRRFATGESVDGLNISGAMAMEKSGSTDGPRACMAYNKHSEDK